MSSAFTVFQTKKNASKPTRFKAEKIQERMDKPQFLKVHKNKAKGVLEASGYLIGTFDSVVAYIIKHKKDVGDVPELQIYYNIRLMITGHKQDLEKFLNDNLPHDTLINADLKDPYQHSGPIVNFNKRWLTSDMTKMLTVDEALVQFNDLKSTQDQYDGLVRYYHNLYVEYFAQAAVKHEATKATKQRDTLTFEELRESLGPFKYPETGIAVLKHIKSHMGEVKKKETKKGGDTTFDKYFVVEPNNIVRVSLSTNSKTGTTSLTAKKEAASSVGGARSKAFRPFPTLAPGLYFNNENIFDAFIHELSSNITKVAGTLANVYFDAWPEIHVNATDSDNDKYAKIQKFFDYLAQEYNVVRQNRLLANTATTQYRPVANVPVSSSFNVYQ